MTNPSDPYAFVTDPDADRMNQDVNVIDDEVEHGPETHFSNDAVGGDVTELASQPEPITAAQPRRFFVRREPRTPEVGKANLFTVNVFGDGVPRQLVGMNINRKQLQVFTDASNTVAVSVGAQDGSGIVQFAPGSLAFKFETCMPLMVSATANSILYCVEENYFSDADGL